MARRDTLIGAMLALALVVLLVPLARLGLDAHHDGIILKPALDVLSGQVLFRDTFTQYGALTTFLQVLALWIHPTVLSVRLLTVATYGMALFLLYVTWRQFLPRSLAVVSCLLFALFIPATEMDYWNYALWPLVPWSSVFAIMFQGIGLYALFRIIRGEEPVRAGMLLGVAVAAAFWCRQPVGLIMAGCVGVIWGALHWAGWAPTGHSGRAILLAMLKGSAVVSLPIFAYLALFGALPEWWYQNFIWPGKWSEGMDWYDTLVRNVHPDTTVWLLLLLVAAALPAWVRRFRPALPAPLVVFYYLGLAGVLAWQHQWTLRVLDLRAGGWTVVLPLIIVLQAVIAAVLAHTRRVQPRAPEYYLVASLAVLSLGSLVQYYPSADPGHVAFALAPTCGLIMHALWRWSGWPAPAVALAVVAVFLPTAMTKVRVTRQAIAQPLVTLTRPAVLRGMRVPVVQAQNYGRVADLLELILKQRPDIPAVVAGNDALPLCFMDNLANGTPYVVNWSALATSADNERRLKYIQRVRPLIFFQRADWVAIGNFYRSARYVPLLYTAEDAQEIAVPQELAAALGLGPYGAPLGPARPAKP